MVRSGVILAAAAALAGCGSAEQQRAAEPRTVTIEVGRSSEASDGGTKEPRAAEGPPPQVPGDETCDNVREATTDGNEREAEMAIRCLTNAVRRKEGLEELGFDERLARAAATRSNDMARLGYFSHDGPDGGNVQRAVRRTGWVPESKSWLLGENIGWAPKGQATPAQLMRSWLDSPTHRANILNDGFTEMGVGAIAGVPVADEQAGATYTQVFGVTGARARRAQTG